MSMIRQVTAATATPAQQRVADIIAGNRGNDRYTGPYSVLLNNPELAERANHLGDYLRRGAEHVPPRLAQLVILLTVRHWGAKYAWNVHSAGALRTGFTRTFVEAVHRRQRPAFANPDDETVYDYVMAVLANKGVPEEVEKRAVALLGEVGVVDVVAIAGFYSMVAFACNAFAPKLQDSPVMPLDD